LSQKKQHTYLLLHLKSESERSQIVIS